MNRITLTLPLFFTLALVAPACGDDAASDEGYDTGYNTGGESGSGGDTAGSTTGGLEGGDEEPEPPPPDDEDTETTGEEPLCNDMDDVVLYLSPDDSNSMSSPVQVREQVINKGGSTTGSAALRPWEFMNYYSFDYPPAEDGSLAISAELRLLEGFDAEQPHYELQIAVTSEDMSDAERPPMNVTLVVDTSGSMSGASIELLRESCDAIAASLREGDKVSMVEWDTENTWSLAGYAVSGPDDETLLSTIAQLEAGGGTDLNGGLTSGYELAQMTWDIDALNRLVLISDGGANAGETDIEIIGQNAVYGGSDGIYLVGVGVGQNNYNDALMDHVTDAGKGASVFINDEAEAWKIFNQDFVNTMALAARDVQVEVTLPPGFEIQRFSGEEYSDDPTEIEPQHLAPNDSMVFFQEVVTCAPELVTDDAEIQVHLTWEDVESFEDRELTRAFSFAELYDADISQLLKGGAILAYAEALVALRFGTDQDKTDEAVARADAAIAEAQAALPDDLDLAEVAEVWAAVSP